MTEVRQQLSHQVRGRRGRAVDPAWAHRMLLLRAADTLSEQAAARLEKVFATDDPTGKAQGCVGRERTSTGHAAHRFIGRR
nr:hypothetical protein [Arthrobacter sp. E3]